MISMHYEICLHNFRQCNYKKLDLEYLLQKSNKVREAILVLDESLYSSVYHRGRGDLRLLWLLICSDSSLY